jgi:hypothetical protein
MQLDTDSKRLRKVALTAITIATLLVLATGVSCAAPVRPEQPAPLRHKGPNQLCDTCHDAQAGDLEMQLYVFVPGKPDMDDYDAGEKLLQGEDSTAMGFSSRGCLPPAPPKAMAFDLATDAGAPPDLGSYVNVFQAGPPPVTMKHPCSPAPGKSPGAYKLCEEPVGANGMLQPDGVVYFRAITDKMNDYRFIPCKFARAQKIRSYDDAKKLQADQWIHFTGTHSGQGPTWAVTRQP